MTTWFRLLALLAAGTLIWLGVRWRLAAIQRLNRRLRAQIYDVEARFSKAYENAPIGIGLVDTDGMIYDANPNLKTLFWPRAEAEDREQLSDIVVEPERDGFRAFLNAATSPGATTSQQRFECVADDGRHLRVNFKPSVIRKRDGSVGDIVLIAQDVTEQEQMTRKLEFQARYDELTGLVNRREFVERLEKQTSTAGFLMYLDLDQFKVVNDSCGHAAGDELLRDVAGILQDEVGDADTVARLGGDEFAILLEGAPQEQAVACAERIREAIHDYQFVWSGETYRIGVSIGLVATDGPETQLEELQKIADAACYAAKEAGRNRVHIVTDDDRATNEQRGQMRLVQRLNEAIEQDQFVLFGQRLRPVRPDAAGAENVEVLLRFPEPGSDRLLMPSFFLPAAERYGLRSKLDSWVVGRVVSTLRSLDSQQLGAQQFWVNLSGASLRDDQFRQEVLAIIDSSGLPKGVVNFDIAEGSLTKHYHDVKDYIEALRARGCRFALDDFGTQHSSFVQLKRLGVDVVKIDGPSMREIERSDVDRIFVKAIIDIAHRLGLEVVAGFVENEGIASAVEALGADYHQGFVVHRPEPLATLLGMAENTDVAQTNWHDAESA
jgi:Amt family ammonium transporter